MIEEKTNGSACVRGLKKKKKQLKHYLLYNLMENTYFSGTSTPPQKTQLPQQHGFYLWYTGNKWNDWKVLI